MKTVNDLVDEFKRFLNNNHSEHFNAFNQRYNDQPEAAKAEAVIFSFFNQNGYDIWVEETSKNKGGVDFRVRTESSEFVVEVTSVSQDTFTKKSGVPTTFKSSKVFTVSSRGAARQIRQEAFDKAKQMSGYNCPAILIITSEHLQYEHILQNKNAPFGASMFMMSPPGIAIEHNPKIRDDDTATPISFTSENATNLEYSLFLKFNERGRIEFCRKQISAVLLFHIRTHEASIVGLLHPKPIYRFSHKILPSVPFIKALIPESVLSSEMEDYSIADFGGGIESIWIPDESFPYRWFF
jgi:hypothetical protein